MPDAKKQLHDLYKLPDQLIFILDLLEENPDIPQEELLEQLAITTQEFNEKVEQVALAVRNSESRATSMRFEVERLENHARSEENKVKRLKDSLLTLMNAAAIQKVAGKVVTVSVANNGGELPISLTCEPKDLPEQFRKETITYSLNREAVKDYQTIGMDLPAVVVVGKRGQNIRIR